MASKFCSFFLLIVLFYQFSPCWSQDSQIDSLELVVERSDSDTSKVKTLNQLAYQLRRSDPKRMLEFSTLSRILAFELSYVKGEAEALRITGLAFKVTGQYDSALYYYNSASALAKINKLPVIQSSVLNNIGNVYRNLGNYDSAQIYLFKALNIRKQHANKDDIASSLINIGNLNNHQGNLSKALTFYKESEILLLETNNQLVLAVVYNNIGSIYWYMSKFVKALKYYQKSAILRNNLQDKAGLATVYTNMGMIYNKAEDKEKAINYFIRAKKLYVDLGDQAGTARSSNDIGMFHHENGDNKQALKYLLESLKIYEKIGSSCEQINPMLSLGIVYRSLNQLERAKKYFLQSLEGARKCSDLSIIISVLNKLASINRNKGDYTLAIDQLNEAYQMASESELELSETIKSLYLLHKELGNNAEALKYFEFYKQKQDSLYGKENTLEIARLEGEYELIKIQKEQEVQAKLKELEQERSLTKEVYLRNAFIIGFVAMIIISFLIYRNYRLKIKDNDLLNQLNLEIQEQQEELRTKADDLKAANDQITHINKNLENIVTDRTKVIANQNQKIIEYITYNSHQVRGPLARVLGLASLLDTADSVEQKKIVKSINSEAQNLDTMVKNMNRELEKQMETKSNPKS